MLSGKIENVLVALGTLGGQVTPEQWSVISSCRAVLKGAQENAVELERRLIPQEEPATPAPKPVQ
jgi:hypothetical protein